MAHPRALIPPPSERLAPASKPRLFHPNYSCPLSRTHLLPPPRERLSRQLQNLDCSTQVFVSLNPHTPPEPGLVHETLRYRHPQFSPRAEGGQRLLSTVNGKRGLWFCGAWRGYGFHEVMMAMRCDAAAAVDARVQSPLTLAMPDCGCFTIY